MDHLSDVSISCKAMFVGSCVASCVAGGSLEEVDCLQPFVLFCETASSVNLRNGFECEPKYR